MKKEYKFTAVPDKLADKLDAPCEKMLRILLKEQFFHDAIYGPNKFFFKSTSFLKEKVGYSESDVRVILETLYRNRIIDINPKGRYHKSNEFRINMNTIMLIDTLSDIDYNSLPMVHKLARKGCKLTYLDAVQNVPESIQTITDAVQNVHPILDGPTNCTAIQIVPESIQIVPESIQIVPDEVQNVDAMLDCTFLSDSIYKDGDADGPTNCTPTDSEINLANKALDAIDTYTDAFSWLGTIDGIFDDWADDPEQEPEEIICKLCKITGWPAGGHIIKYRYNRSISQLNI